MVVFSGSHHVGSVHQVQNVRSKSDFILTAIHFNSSVMDLNPFKQL